MTARTGVISPIRVALEAPVRATQTDWTIPGLVVSIVVASLAFHFAPILDLAVSDAFHDPVAGFSLADNTALRLLRASSTWVLAGLLILALIRIILHGVRGRAGWARGRRWVWLLTGLLVGPGLLVNGALKSLWGRPRPVGTDLFGGEAPFQKAWVVSDWCERNCSFVSGEASSAAWIVAAAFLAPGRVRPFVVLLATAYALALSVNRIAFGGHYLSDVVLAWLLCALVFALLYRLIVGFGPREPVRAAHTSVRKVAS
ncbi:phosphatase PAP2 family protein [Brevundimonas sp. GCM10030266]|uniref:phosphatase PAP2 family protein n=1 Tax=Brevundimonas sp. GCM10030266 TaxID=3273386 RepID=UPI0036209F92